MTQGSQRVLVVDDEADLRELLVITLGRMKLEAEAVGTLTDAYRVLGESSFDLCLTDMNLPDGDGIDLVRHVSRRHPDMPIAMITAHGSMETATNRHFPNGLRWLPPPVPGW